MANLSIKSRLLMLLLASSFVRPVNELISRVCQTVLYLDNPKMYRSSCYGFHSYHWSPG